MLIIFDKILSTTKYINGILVTLFEIWKYNEGPANSS